MKTAIFFIALLPLQVFAFSPSSSKSNQINGFEYASCQNNSCVLISAPKAYMGLSLDAFSTSGETVIKVTDSQGSEKAVYKGISASLNPQMQTLILDTKEGGFVMYSLKDGRITDVVGGGK